MSGIVFFIKVRIKAESIPPLNAIQIFFTDEISSCFLMVPLIDFSINSIEGFWTKGFKSLQTFLGKFGFILGSYLSVRIFVIDSGLILDSPCSELNVSFLHSFLITLWKN